MNNSSKILVIIDSDNDPALVVDRACWLSKIASAKLELLLCDPPASRSLTPFLTSSQAQQMSSEISRSQDERIESLVSQARELGVDATASALAERPIADGILKHIAKTQPLLVVKGTHFHSQSDRSIILSTDWQLIRKCSAPLYLVKKTRIAETPTVVAAVDPVCEHDKPAVLDQIIVDHANSITESTQGKLLLFHSYERLVAIGSAAARAISAEKLPIDDIDKRIKTEHQEALQKFARNNNIDAASVHQLPGKTHELLPAFVRSKGADIVVMGALARWGVKRMVLGSTTERVLDHLPCDVLVVRAPA